VVLLAAPLKPETRGMIDAEVLAACKPGALLVNVGRGGLVDQAALKAALDSGHLGGAGIDVTSPEPLPADDPLWSAANLILSPHCAGAGSPDTLANLGRKVRENLEHFIAGRPLNYVVDFGS
jgi:phosphoglycerate dehydrogenase-like enzyme